MARASRPVSGQSLFRGTAELDTLRQWLDWMVAAYARHGAVLGQVATDAHDEALYLLLRACELPLDSRPAVLWRRPTPAQVARLKDWLRRRLLDRVPAAYLTGEAWLGGARFHVDERVLIPRSYFLEIIGEPLDALLAAAGTGRVRHAVDVCTGSGCLAILLAKHWPAARVDGIDLSSDALAVAARNVAEHGVGDRLTLHCSDVFDTVPARRYELILSNPPYEPAAVCDGLPPEFRHEPRLALDGGADGLDIIRKLLRQSRDRLTPRGLLLVEVGELQAAMAVAWPDLPVTWLPTADGSDCVGLIHAADLRRVRVGGGTPPVRRPSRSSLRS
jgi:ribosomal protein L3 glutamine methyltransferase